MSFGGSPSFDNKTRSNFNHLYYDVVWYGILAGSTLAFLTVYAARIGANSFHMGLISAGPGLVNLLFSLPAGNWLEGKPLIRATFRSAVLTRLGYLVFILLPWTLSNPGQIWGTIWITLLMSIPGTLVAISFNALFAEAVPAQWRTQVVGRRNALLAVMVTITSLLCGWILDRITFPLNYQIVFLIGAVGAMLSSYHLSQIYLKDEPPIRFGIRLIKNITSSSRLFSSRISRFQSSLSLKSSDRPLLRLDLLRGPFGLFMLSYLMLYTFQYVSLPLFSLYYIDNLRLREGTISLGNALFYMMMMVVSLGLNRLGARRGHRFMLVSGALSFGLFPFIMFLAKGSGLYLVANVIGGGIWAVLNAGLINRLMERVPVDDRPAHMALHNIALNLGILAGSMLGAGLVTWTGLKDVMLIGAALRFVAGLLVVLWG